jgi:hypothetical protein
MAVIRSFAVGLVAAICAFVPKAPAVVGCLTNDEARKIWPREHLYWHTAARCWDTSTPAEFRARTRNTGRWISALGLAEATQYSLFLVRFAKPSTPYLWIDALGWWPSSGQNSFDSRWNEDMRELGQAPPRANSTFLMFAMAVPLADKPL